MFIVIKCFLKFILKNTQLTILTSANSTAFDFTEENCFIEKVYILQASLAVACAT